MHCHPTSKRTLGPFFQKPAAPGLLLSISLGFVLNLFLTSSSEASWSEAGLTIHTLDEIQSYVESSFSTQVQPGAVNGQTPILVPSGADLNDPKVWPAALLQSGIALEHSGNVAEWVRKDPTTSPLRVQARKITATPTSPSLTDPDAISTGSVYLGGQHLSGPVRIEVVGTAVHLNGIAVFPPPGPRVGTVSVSSQQRDEFDLVTELMNTFESNRTRLGTEAAQQELKASFEQDAGVQGVTWVVAEVARLAWKDGREEYLNFEERRQADTPDPEFAQEHLETQAELLRNVLRDNATLVCGASYLIPIYQTSAHALQQTVNRVRASAESEALKLLRLQAHIGNREAAADLLSVGN